MNRIKSLSLISLVLLLVNFNLSAQRRHGDFQRFSDRLFFGGSIGLAVGSHVTQVDVVPMLGMWVLPQWSVGVGGRYSFRKERFNVISGESQSLKTHIWGVSGFTQVLPIPDFHETFNIDVRGGIVLHGEYEGLYMDKKFFDSLSSEGKGWVHMYLIGGGWRQRMGDRAAINILILWDLSNSRYSPYTSNPIMRFSITF